MSAENTRESVSAVERLGACLKSLYEEAKKARGGGVTYGQIARDLRIATSTLGGWLNGQSGLSEKNLPKYRALVAHLEKCAGRPHLHPGEWQDLMSKALAESSGKQRVGRPAKTARPTRGAPFRFNHMAEAYRPQMLSGREAELDQLQALIRQGPGYLALVAPPWAGKTALLATFVSSNAEEDVDLIAYFVRWRQGTDRAEAFLRTMVSELSRHVGKRANRVDQATLFGLYEEAARTSAGRGRVLCLIVDGLDEDAEARIGGGPSIASLLPPRRYLGLRVLVSRREHPPLPGDVPKDHPLRRAERVPGFRPSPEAGVLRSTALDDLAALFDDSRGWVHEIVGLLALVDGGLSERDLIQLVEIGGHAPVPLPFDLKRVMRSVAGRVLEPADLEPDTFVLAHEELYDAATDGLGPEMLTRLSGRLHTWADRYQADGWPESTPMYLLHHYQEFLKDTGDLARWTDFTLDHRRLLRLSERGRPDVALASLDHITQETSTPTVLAAAAASRSLVTAQNRLVPRQVLRVLGEAGDVTRARALALTPTDPLSKAARLLEIVQVLLTVQTPKAAERAAALAREAAAWAERAQRQNPLAVSAGELETDAVVPRIAVVLAATGHLEPAIRLLRSIDICRPDNVAAVAEAAALLREPAPASSAWLLDELTSEAEYQAESPEGSLTFAMHIWSAIAGADPGRAVSACRRMEELSQELEEESAHTTEADGSTLWASEPTESQPGDASNPASNFLHLNRNALLDDLPEESARLQQELLAAGEAPQKVSALLTDVKESEQLLKGFNDLSSLGDGAQLCSLLNQFMQKPATQSSEDAWLPFLSQALASAGEDVDNKLLPLLQGEFSALPLHIRVLTSAALVYADEGHRDEASRCVKKAAEIATGLADPQPETLTIAQAFAHLGDSEQAARWAAPPHGRRPTGKAGILYRRAAVAVDMGLHPKSAITRILGNASSFGLNAAGADLLKILSLRAGGVRPDAQMASLKTTACSRLGTDPLITTGLSMLHAMLGEPERARDLTAQLSDPAARGVAQAILAEYLAGVPAYLDVTAQPDLWTLSVLRVIVNDVNPACPDYDEAVQNLVNQVLTTSSWHWALPTLGRKTPESVLRMLNVLDQHQQVRQSRR
ncbi:hypothetical protein [Streptomyces sp. NPDC006668]|uniref:hypothetical protein n=1 Tax=Streptomyces sp. NPDC006668 TaxID=3156903 RepID=UPI00340BFEF9